LREKCINPLKRNFKKSSNRATTPGKEVNMKYISSYNESAPSSKGYLEIS
jgi:hypothetical protein